ncbi:hypothetical protein KI387_022991 [Taxus chinensis]|uniref:Uncharacterized protein n=1 Tax=Taxus chinensis TaxID=29808 RepID=A0AA38G1D3_TAXCH|nr:hypothetical protein KI387_022991 [Taxus chinensis]
MNYMDMHLKLGYKTEQARKEYHTIASKWLIRGRNRESSHMDETTLRESALVSSNSNEVCKNLYDEFDRHVDDLFTSSLQEVPLEASSLEPSIEHVTVLDSNGMDSLGLSHEDNLEFSVDDHVLHGVDDFVDDVHSGPVTHELYLMGVEDIHSSSLVMSPIYDMAALTHGETNEEESASVGIQSTCVGYENSTDGALVKLENIAKKNDMSSDFYDSIHVSLLHHERMPILHEDDNAMGPFIGGIQELGVKNGFCVMNSSHKNSDFLYQT